MGVSAAGGGLGGFGVLRAPHDPAASSGAPMEQEEPDVVELQDSDEGDMVRRVFIGEGGPKTGEGEGLGDSR